MLTFRNTNIVAGALITCMLVVELWYNVPLYVYLLPVAAYMILLVYGSYSIGSNFFFPVVCSAKTKEKVVAISFDDGPVPEYTPEVLQVLKEQDVPAAFFCIGKRIVQNRELCLQLHEQGHIIGNHSFSHTPLFDLLPSDKMLDDLKRTDEAIFRLVGFYPRTFRPPYGVTTPGMKKALMAGGYTAIGWNIRSLDTIARNEDKLLAKLMKLLRPGSVILLHDTQKITLAVLPRFIRAARNEGYKFVRLDTLLNINWYA